MTRDFGRLVSVNNIVSWWDLGGICSAWLLSLLLFRIIIVVVKCFSRDILRHARQLESNVIDIFRRHGEEKDLCELLFL
jgi:hypothetical protein